MFPYEYAVILKALKELAVPVVNVYLEANSVSDENLNGHIHRVKHYYNKRFYKFTPENFECHEDLQS